MSFLSFYFGNSLEISAIFSIKMKSYLGHQVTQHCRDVTYGSIVLSSNSESEFSPQNDCDFVSEKAEVDRASGGSRENNAQSFINEMKGLTEKRAWE